MMVLTFVVTVEELPEKNFKSHMKVLCQNKGDYNQNEDNACKDLANQFAQVVAGKFSDPKSTIQKAEKYLDNYPGQKKEIVNLNEIGRRTRPDL